MYVSSLLLLPLSLAIFRVVVRGLMDWEEGVWGCADMEIGRNDSAYHLGSEEQDEFGAD